MSTPYYASSDDGEGTSAHPIPGSPGATERSDYLSAWSTIGYTAQLGANGQFEYGALIPSSAQYADNAQLPTGISSPTTVTQRYFSPDGDPLGGFLTFMPSSAITVTSDSVTYRIPRRLSGTETWPALDSGVSPWAFSMEGSGSIYIWLGLMTVVLLPCDSSSIVTDDGNPLTYHVVEHFIGGKQFDISVPTTTSVVDLYSSIIPGTIRPAAFDPINPLGSLLEEDLWNYIPPATAPQPLTFVFAQPSNLWVANYSLDHLPEVLCVSNSGQVITGEVSYPSPGIVHVSWGTFALSGTMVLS